MTQYPEACVEHNCVIVYQEYMSKDFQFSNPFKTTSSTFPFIANALILCRFIVKNEK